MKVIFNKTIDLQGEDGKWEKKEDKQVYKGVVEVTTYQELPWRFILWTEGSTGLKAYAFKGYESDWTTFIFESIGESARFKEDLRLQEEIYARRSKDSETIK